MLGIGLVRLIDQVGARDWQNYGQKEQYTARETILW